MKSAILKSLFFFVLLTLQLVSMGQKTVRESSIHDVKLFVDTTEYRWSRDRIYKNKREVLPFQYDDEDEVMEVYVSFDENSTFSDVLLIPSADFFLIDSLLIFRDYIHFKVRFNDLTKSGFLNFTFKVSRDSAHSEIVEVPLYPYTNTYVNFYPESDELYIGEEKVFELTTNNVENIQVDNRWTEGLPINYRISKEGPNLFLHLLPNETGKQQINVPFTVKKPFKEDGILKFDLPPVQHHFTIKTGRLAFLQFDVQEVTPKDDKTEPIEIQIDNSRLLKLNKTYRIEDQEDAGGPLIAELYTKARLNNDKVLCLLRPYAFHRKSEGYLYIKDGDHSEFVTNLDITPKTTIQAIYIQREGKDWQKTDVIKPGETINVKLEGEGMHKARFSFPGTDNLEYDSLIKNENISLFKVKVPLNISTHKIEIFNHNQSTGQALRIEEFARPRAFDYINLDFGQATFNLADVDKPIYYGETITDLVFDFDRSKIDEGNELYGKQYLTIKVRISNKSGNLIELYQFDDVVVCPNESSPRFLHYDDKDCRGEDINLNNYLSKKTSELEEWSRIELEISNNKDKYGGQGKTKKVLIYLKRDYNFDIEVSFPTGLLILKEGTSGFDNFSTVSFAMIAQLSFYQPGKIAKYRPYKIGAGFIAFNAFDFSSSSDRDVGLVVLGSLYPVSSSNKLSFPLYAGGGFLMGEKKFFFLIGPGIRVTF